MTGSPANLTCVWYAFRGSLEFLLFEQVQIWTRVIRLVFQLSMDGRLSCGERLQLGGILNTTIQDLFSIQWCVCEIVNFD